MACLCIALTSHAFTPRAEAQLGSGSKAPVTITDCRGGIASLELVEVAAYDVSLRNTALVAADEIRLTIQARRKNSLTFDLKGTFDPGSDAKRRVQRSVGFGLYSYSSATNECSVEFVHFVNGTSWSKG